jgi:protease I
MKGAKITPSTTFEQVTPEQFEQFDMLLIPGGGSPENLRIHEDAVDFSRRFMQSDRPVAAICHGPQLLISVNALRGRSVTCWPSIAIDVKNAGGLYMDKPVVQDGPIITARKSDDIPHFVDAIVRAITRD